MKEESLCLSIWGFCSLISIPIVSILSLIDLHYAVISCPILELPLIAICAYLFILSVEYVIYHFNIICVPLEKIYFCIFNHDIFYMVEHIELSSWLAIISCCIIICVFGLKLYLHLNFPNLLFLPFTYNLIYFVWSHKR